MTNVVSLPEVHRHAESGALTQERAFLTFMGYLVEGGAELESRDYALMAEIAGKVGRVGQVALHDVPLVYDHTFPLPKAA